MITFVLNPRLEQEGLSDRECDPFFGQTTAAISEEETISGRVQTQRLVFRDVERRLRIFIGVERTIERTFVDWIYPIFEELCELLDLPKDWDSYGAPQIEKQSVIDALYLLSNTASALTPKPWVVPTSHGGVKLEWHTGGIDLEIEVGPHAKGSVFYEDRSKEYKEKECNLKAEIPHLRELIEKLPRQPHKTS